MTWSRFLTSPRTVFCLGVVGTVAGLILFVAELVTQRRPLFVALWIVALLAFGRVVVREWRSMNLGVSEPSDRDLELPGALGAEVDRLVEVGQFAQAVRLVRERTGLGLSEASHAIKAREEAQRGPRL